MLCRTLLLYARLCVLVNDCEHKLMWYVQLGLYKEAVTDFTAALAVDPKNANAYCNRGSSLEKVCG